MPLLMLIFFGLYGWIEFEAFILVGNLVGGLVTFLGIFITAFIGIALMKQQGASILRRWQANLSRGEVNTSALSSGISLILGAVLMLLPGYVTDMAGLLCFIPGLRSLIGQVILSRLSTNILSSGFASRFTTAAGGPSGFSEDKADEGWPHTQPSSRPSENTLGGEVIEGQYETKNADQK